MVAASRGAARGAPPAEADSAHWRDRPIVRVALDGLGRTRPFVLLRELSCREGDRLDWERLERDRLRLLDLDLFARVVLRAERDSASDRPVLGVEVRERPTRYLLPNLEYDEEDGFTYGLFGAELNFAGRAWRGGFSSGWGGRRYVSVAAGAPWVAGRRLAAGLACARSRQTNRGEEQQEDRVSASAALAPTRGPRWSFPCELGVETVRTDPEGPDSLRPSGRDDHRWLGAGFRHDSRDSRVRALRGSVVGLRAVGHGGILGGSTSLQRYELDLLRTVPTGGGSALTVAGRGSWSRGGVPRFLRLGLGGASNLRGHDISEYRGENRWFGWVEERFPLMAQREFRLAGDRETLDLTIEGDLFADVGSVWDGDALQRGVARMRWGAGAGLRFLVPWISVLQCDAATDGRRFRLHVLTGLRL
jgi:outer membrane protein assembly factor BamA